MDAEPGTKLSQGQVGDHGIHSVDPHCLLLFRVARKSGQVDLVPAVSGVVKMAGIVFTPNANHDLGGGSELGRRGQLAGTKTKNLLEPLAAGTCNLGRFNV